MFRIRNLIPCRTIVHSKPIRRFSISLLRRNDHIPPIFLPDFDPPVDNLQSGLVEFYNKRPKFINPHLTTYPIQLKSYELEDIILSKSYAPVSTFKEISDTNYNNVAICGSFVQYDSTFGIVLREATSKFNDNHNKLTILTVDNNIETVYAQDIICHFHGVISSTWIKSLQILEWRHDKTFYSRLVLLDLIKHFANKGNELVEMLQLPKLLEIIYSQNCSPDTVVAVKLYEMVESLHLDDEIRAHLNSSYFDQSVVLYALHNSLMTMKNRFIVSNAYPRMTFTNVSTKGSNMLSKEPLYLLLPLRLATSIDTFTNDLAVPQRLSELNAFIRDFQSQQASEHRRSQEDLHFLFSLWEARNFAFLIEVLKFQIVFPNETIGQSLNKLDCFKHLQTVNSQDIIKWLKSVGIYTEETDVITSINLWGETNHVRKISTTSTDDFKSHLTVKTPPLKQFDLFRHVRDVNIGTDDVIYGIPLSRGTNIGVSLQKLNARNYSINIHIPDIITKVLPNSETFSQMSRHSWQQSIIKFAYDTIKVFDPNFIKSTLFTDRNIEDDSSGFMNVADINFNTSKLKPSTKKLGSCTCLTLSFKYNTYDSNPFKDFGDRVSFSLSDISNAKVKSLDLQLLEESLAVRNTSLPFAFFRSRNPEPVSKLNNDDYHNLGFIYNILKSHFSVRNINGAANTAVESKNPKALFFQHELDNFAGNLTALFCKENEIPVMSRTQALLPELEESDPKADEVLIKHNNMFLPDYHANSFFQTLVSRDTDGNVSLAAFLAGRNYLSNETYQTNPDRHTTLGLENGYVSILEPANSFEALLNQFQIVCHIQHMFMVKHLMSFKANEYKLHKQYSYLKGNGFNLNGPLPKEIVDNHLINVVNSESVGDYAFQLDSKYWTLKNLEKILMSDAPPEFECVVTSPGTFIPSIGKFLCKCFVKQLNTEVEILLESVQLNAVVRSEKVVLLNPEEFICVLQESVLF